MKRVIFYGWIGFVLEGAHLCGVHVSQGERPDVLCPRLGADSSCRPVHLCGSAGTRPSLLPRCAAVCAFDSPYEQMRTSARLFVSGCSLTL